MTSFDQKTTKHHRTARFTFVPWMVRLFNDGPVRSDSPRLPIGDAEALTDETVVAIQEVATQVCWQFLTKECGWKKIEALDPGNPETHAKRRLWKNRSIPVLEFSTATPNLLITIFNETRKDGDMAAIQMPDCSKLNGDFLIHHLVFRRISTTPQAFGLNESFHPEQWLANPLNALYDPLNYRNFDASKTRWNRLCDSDLAPFVPWLGDRQVGKWQEDSLNFRSAGFEPRLRWLEAMTFLLTDWGLEAEKAQRIDLAGFMLDLMVSHLKWSEKNFAEFEQSTRDLPLGERQSLAVLWTDFISLVDPLEASARKCLDIHPIERTGAQKCFLARWEELGFSEMIEQLRAVSQLLRPSIS